MTMYGLYVHDPATDDFVWFTTDKSLEPGSYILDRHHSPSPDVYVAESIPALVLRVGALLEQAEDRAQSYLSPTGTPSDVEHRITTEMTEGLLRRLTETSSIWVSSPDWVDDLRPVSAHSG